MSEKPDPQKIGRYHLQKMLGEGGMSAVYLAERDDGLTVALKVLPRSLAQDHESLERFKREAAVMMGLDHPNIVKCLDVDSADGYHFMAMEYISGGDAEMLLQQRGGRLDEGAVFQIALDIARALECANMFGLLHRDIKPENILFREDGRACLTDFGLVKKELSYGRLTQVGKAMGTPHFMSPEQARGQRMLDGRTDFFSLGSTCYYLLTGETPYDGETSYQIVSKLATEPPPPIRQYLPELPAQSVMIINHLMARDPEDRPANPTVLIELLEKHVAGEKLNPLPPFMIFNDDEPVRDDTDSESRILRGNLDEISQRKRESQQRPAVSDSGRMVAAPGEGAHLKHIPGGSSSYRRRSQMLKKKTPSDTPWLVIGMIFFLIVILASIVYAMAF